MKRRNNHRDDFGRPLGAGLGEWFDSLRWRLFGETSILWWYFGIGLTLVLGFWAFGIHIIWHFIAKYW